MVATSSPEPTMPDDDHIIRNLQNSPAPFDTALLPPEAGRRLQILRDGVRDAAAFTSGLAYRTIQLLDERQAASARLTVLKKLRAGDDHPEMIALTAALADIDEERNRIDERLNVHNAATGPRSDLLRAIERWLVTNSGRYGFKQATVQTKPQKGDFAGAVEKLRFRIREIDALQNRTESAIYPLSTAVQVAQEFVRARARPPIASSCLEHAGPMVIDGRVIEPAILFPTMMQKADVATAQGGGVATGEVQDHFGFLCWLMPEQIVARITEDLLRPDSDDANALTVEQRRSKLATIAQDRLLIEAEECELLFQSLAAGVVIEARPDTSPQAFLSVTLVDKAEEPAVDDAMSRARDARTEGQPFSPRDVRVPGMPPGL
jgi:hypothetical protein